MQADTVKMAIKKLTDTLENYMHHFQCQQSEFKCKKVPNISDQNKQINYRYFTLVHAHTMTVKTFILYDNPTIKNKNNNPLTFVPLDNLTQNFCEVHFKYNKEFCTVKTNCLKDKGKDRIDFD